MRAALQAAMEKGFFKEDGKQPMAGACFKISGMVIGCTGE
jgi:hypothetical protein